MTNRTNSAGFLEPSQIQAYLKRLKKEGASPATLKRKEAALKKFQSWQGKEYGPKYPLPKGAPKPKKIISKGISPKIFPPFLRYFSFLIGLVLLAGLGWGVYSQFFAQPKETPSMALPTNPPLLISFQGQLTDEVGTPINATVSATFRLYNVDEGGNALWEEQKNVSTDQDGIFNTFLGDTTTLDPVIFRDNMNLWLAIEIDNDGEMDPRQQIATVGYAFNSRYLQGYEATTAATANTIPVINAGGDLILASSSPAIEATSGTFGLKGEAITIQSTGGVGGGDILIQPDADTQGQVIIYSATTADNSFTVQNSNITTGSLIYGEAGTSASGYNLLKLASGSTLTDKFVVDYAGNTDIAGNLTVDSSGFFGANIGIGTTSPGAPLDVSGGTGVVAQFSGRVIGGNAVNDNEFITKGQLGSVGVTSVTGTANQITANPITGNVVLSIPADFRAPGSVNATTGLYTGAGAGTLRLDASGALSNITTYSGSGNITSSGGVLSMGGTGNNYFAGNVGIGTTSPSSKLQLAGSGNLFSIGDTTGNTFFSVTDSLITSNLPHTFTSSGDVSMAYDLYFTNQASSKIESYGPLSIVAGEPHESNNLTLRTYNAGKLILESANLWADGANVGIGTTSPAYKLDVNGDIRIASGSDLYIGTYGLNDNASVNSGASLVGLYDDTMAYVAANTNVQGAIKELDTAIGNLAGGTSGLWLLSGSNLYPKETAYNVGIGITNPGTYKLNVAGNTYLGGTLTTSGTISAGSTLYLANGTAYSPALTFTNDTNSGLYRLAEDRIGLVTGGTATKGITIDSAGNVGIGTTGPQQKLTLGSGSNFATEMATPGAPTLTCNTSGGTLADGTYYYKIVASDGAGYTTGGTSNSCTITGGSGAGSVSISWTAITGASSYRVYGRDTGYGQYWTSSTPSYTDTGTAGTTGTPPTATTAYVNKLTASGNSWLLGSNVGIGTTSPGAKLALADHTTSAGGILFGTDTNLYRRTSNVLKTDDTFEAATYRVGTTDVITSGRIFRAADGSAAAPAFSFSADTNTGIYRGGTDILRFSTAGADRMTILANGNVGIGTVFTTGAPADKLTVAGGNATIYNTATLGSEKVTNGAFADATAWTWGTGWTHDTTNLEADHTAGNTAALEQSVSAVAGEIYQVVFTVKNRTAGSVTPQVGGVNGAAVSSNTTSTQQIRATGTGNLKFTPTSDFNGSIDDVSVKLVTGGDLKLAGLLTGGGSSGIKVTANGNVGIGTTAPTHKLQIEGDLALSSGASVRKAGTVTSLADNTYTDIAYFAVPLPTTTQSASATVIINYIAASYRATSYRDSSSVSGRAILSISRHNESGATETEVEITKTGVEAKSGTMGNIVQFKAQVRDDNTGTQIVELKGKIDTTSSGTVYRNLSYDINLLGKAGTNKIITFSDTAGSTDAANSSETDNNFIWTTGNVGIGTTSPGHALEINGDLFASGAFYDSAESAGSAGYILQSTGVGTSWSAVSDLSVGNADTLDTLDSTDFLRATASDIFEAGNTLTINGSLDVNGNLAITDTDIALDGATTNLTATGNFSINNDDLFIQKASGNVGIGTTNPEAKLSLFSPNNYDGALFKASAKSEPTNYNLTLNSTLTGSNVFYSFDVTSTGNSYPNNLVLDRGSVGIGTTNPGAKLDVQGGNLRVGSSPLGDYDILGRLGSFDTRSVNSTPQEYRRGIVPEFKSNTTDGLSDGGTYHGVLTYRQWSDWSGGGVRQIGFTDSHNLWIRGANADNAWSSWQRILDTDSTVKTSGVLQIDGTGNSYILGNVGIGTTNPGQKLTIEGTAPVAEIRSGGYLMIRPTANDWDMRIGSGNLGSNMYMGFFSGGDLVNPRMVVTAPGNVGIGTTSPGAKLEIAGGIRAGSAILPGGQNSGYSFFSGSHNILAYADKNPNWTVTTTNILNSSDLWDDAGGTFGIPDPSQTTASIEIDWSSAKPNSFSYGLHKLIIKPRWQENSSYGYFRHIKIESYVSGWSTLVDEDLTWTNGTYISPDLSGLYQSNKFKVTFSDPVAGSSGNQWWLEHFALLHTNAPVYDYYVKKGAPVFWDTINTNNNWISGDGGAEGISIDNSGNVGIGTITPTTFKLQVAGDVGPNVDSTFNLGSDTVRWANIYADNIYGSVSGSVSFADITSGDNNDANMTVSGSASLGYSGSGIINASSLQGASWGAPLGIGTTTPNTGAFTTLSAGTSLTTPLVDNSGSLGIGTSNQTGLTLGRSGATTTINGSSIVLGTQASSTTHAVRADRNLIAGNGLTGGGNLTADRTFNVGGGNGITVNTDDVAVNQGYNFAWTGTQSWSNTATFNGNLLFGGSTGILSSGGNVGIGTTSPSFKLQLAGSGNLFSIGDTTGNTFFSVTDSLITSNLPHTFTSSGDVSMAYDLYFTNQASSKIESYGPLSIVAGEPHESNNLTLRTYNAGKLILESANLWADGSNVGIGTTSPGHTLEINGDLFASGAFYDSAESAGSNGYVLQSTGAGTSWATLSSLSVGNADTLDGLDSLQFLRSDISDNYTSGTLTFNSSTELDIASGASLDVNGDLAIADTDITLDGASTNLTSTGNFSINSDDLFVDKATGNVGIGTTEPASKLTTAGTGYIYNEVRTTSGSGRYSAGFRAYNDIGAEVLVDIYSSTSDLTAFGIPLANLIRITDYGSSSGMVIGTRGVSPLVLGTSSTARMYISTSGNVGIGTTSPGATLDVNGNLRIGTLATGATNTVLTHNGNIVQQRTIDSRVWGSTLVDGSGTAGYNAYWSDANTLTGEQYVNVARGGLGANMTAAGAGELVYSTSTTTYGHLAAGTLGQIIKSGGAGAPTWNTPSALTKTDDTNITLTLGGSASTALVNPASISVGWSGQLSLARGGTNNNLTASAGSVVYSDADSLELTGVGTAGQFLVSGGTGAPTWTSTIPATSLKWNALTSPDGNLSLNHNEYTTTFTWGASTGANNLFTLTDTANNTGTGYLLNLNTASGSTLKPLHISAGGTEALAIGANGNVGIGTINPEAKLHLDYGYNPTGNTYLNDWVVNSAFERNPFFSTGVAQNFLLRTEEFNDSAWAKVDIGAVSANGVGAPHGQIVAENIPAGTTATANIAQTVTNSTTGYWTAAVWARAQSGTATIKLRIDSSGETGTEKTYTVGTKWQFLTVTQNLTAAHTTKTFRIITGTNAVSLWAAQLNQGDKPKAYYQRTTSAATGNSFGIWPASGLYWQGNASYAGSSGYTSGYATYGIYSGYTLSNTSNKTNQWEYVGNIYLAYNSTYRYGSSWNIEFRLKELSQSTAKTHDQYEDVKLVLKGYLPTVADGNAFHAAIPSFSVEIANNNLGLTKDDVAMLVYSSSTSNKYLRLYVRLKNPNTHYALATFNRYGASYDINNNKSNSYCYFNYANDQAVVASLPTPAQGSIVYGTYSQDSNFWRLNTNDIYNWNTGNVGIGTTDPGSYKLNVAGNSYVGGTLTTTGAISAPTSSNTINGLVINGAGVVTTGTWNASLIPLAYGGTNKNLTANAGAIVYSDADSLELTGVGTPGQILMSNGAAAPTWATLSSLSVGNADTLDGLDSLQFLRSDTSDNYTSGTLTFDSATELDIASGASLDVNGDLAIADTDITLDGATTNLTTTGNFSINGDDLFVDKATGNVGIGTTAPGYKLDVVGNLRLAGPLVNTAGSTNYDYKNVLHYQNNNANQVGAMVIDVPRGGNTMLYIKISGYNHVSNEGAWEAIIGGYWYQSGNNWINTSAEIRGSAPFRTIRLMKDGSNNPKIVLGLVDTVWQFPQFKIDVYAGYSEQANYTSGWAAVLSTDLSALTNLSTPSIKTYITSAGNVGIGTTSPGATLDVNGNLRIGTLATGTTNAVLTHNGNIVQQRTIDSRVWGSTLVDGSGTAGYNAYWSDANTLTGEQYVNVARGGLGANMTAAGAGELVYSTSTTAYGHLAAGTPGQILQSNGTGAPSWVNASTVGTNYWQKNGSTLTPLTASDNLSIGSTTPGSATFYAPGTTNQNAWFNLGTGNLGIGTTSPGTYKLNVAGSLIATDYYAGDGTQGVNGTVSGLVFKDGLYTSGAISGFDNYQYWRANTGTTTYNITSTNILRYVSGDTNNLSIALSGGEDTDETMTFTVNLNKDLVAGGGLSGGADNILVGADSDITLSHADTSSQGNSDNANLTFIQDISLDTYGHLTSLATNSIGAINGLSTSGTNILLGGSLTQGTTITQGAYDMIFNLSSTGDFRIQDNGVDALFVRDDGNVGIGTTNLGTYKLNVNGTTSIGSSLYVAGNERFNSSGALIPHAVSSTALFTNLNADLLDGQHGSYYLPAGNISGTINRIAKFTGSNSLGNASINDLADALAITIDSFEQVGIGTTSPGSKLTVAGGASYFDALPAPTGVTANPTSGGSLTSGTYYYVVNAFDANSLSSNKSTEVSCTVDGSTTTACQISWTAVAGAANYRVFGRSSNSQNQYWQTTSPSYTDTGAAGTSGTPPGPISAFFTGNIKAERFADSANDTYYLDPAYTTLSLTTAGAAGIGYSAGQMSDATAKLAVDGNVGIGTTSPGAKLALADHTTSAGGILFGTDTNLYRRTSNVLKTDDTFEATAYRVGTTDVITSGRIFQAADGSATAPAFSFSADTNTGMYRGGTDILRFSTAGADRMTILANGNVGMGTTSPGAKLDVVGGAIRTDNQLISTIPTGTAPLAVSSTTVVSNLNADTVDGYHYSSSWPNASNTVLRSNSTINYIPKWNGTYTLTNSLIYDNGTNVGIGTTGPQGKLDVDGRAYVNSLALDDWGTIGAAAIHWTGETGTGIFKPALDTIAFTINSNEKIRIDSSGNVGIGTTSPGVKLDVVGGAIRTDNQLISTIPTGTAPLAVSSTTVVSNLNADTVDGYHYSSSWPNPSNMVTGSGTSNYISKWTGTYTQGNSIIYDNGTNVGIGTTGPETNLHVVGNTLIEGDLSLNRDDLNALAMNPSMVPNWSFEVHNSDDDIPDGWFGWGQNGTYSRTRTSSQRRHGSYSLAIYATSGSYAAVRSSCIPVTPGQTYQYAMSVKSSAATTKGLIWRVLKYTDSRCTTEDGYSELIGFDAGVGTSWSQKTQTGTAVGSNTYGISIQVFNYYPNVNATFYFDRFVVRESAYNSTDLAEMVPAENEKIDQAEIVSIDKETGKVKLSTKPYDKKIFGIVSTQPGIILQNENEIQPKATVALAGRVPVKISTTNGNIQPGDPITSSSLPGIGTKATQAGTIVGNAMEGTENWNEAICPAVSSLNDINWPKDDGLNPERPCYKLPDGTYVGKIMAFVNTSWSDSQVYLTDSGDIKLIGETTEETKIYQVKDKENNPITRIGAFGEAVIGKIRSGLIETNNLIADNITAKNITTQEKIISPLVETEQLNLKTQNAKVKTTTQNAKVTIVNSQDEPTAEFDTETKDTTLFGDLEVNGNVGIGQEVSAPKANFGDLLAQNVGIGQLEAESVKTEKLDVAQDATISGTLYVDRVVAREGGFGELLAENISIESIKSIVKEEVGILNSTQGGQASQDDGGGAVQDDDILSSHSDESQNLNSGEPSQEEFDLQALLTKVEEWARTSVGNDLPLECAGRAEDQILNQVQDDGLLVSQDDEGGAVQDDKTSHSGLDPESKNLCLVDTNLTVLGGHTSLANTSIAGQLSVGSLVINNNSLDVLGDTLYLQKLAMGGLDILNGKLTVDINGNVFIAAHLTVGGGIATNEIMPMEGGDLTINLDNAGLNGMEDKISTQEETGSDNAGFGKLLVKGINNETVASIDASGSAEFKKISTDLLEINTAKEASQSGEVIIAAAENFENIGIFAPGLQTNATAGEAVLPAGEKEIIIYNSKITDQSLVYLTPTADTENKILYVKEKVGNTNQEQELNERDTNGTNGGYFVVGLNEALNWPVKFNWWIIN